MSACKSDALMKVYISDENKLLEVDGDQFFRSPPTSVVWIDLLQPTKEEIKKIEEQLQIEIPTIDEMKEIEPSSRLYSENDALFMTMSAVKKEQEKHSVVNITFILKHNTLVSIRYDEFAAMNTFLKWVTTKPPFPVNVTASLLLGAIEAFISRIADNLESISAAIELLSQDIFIDKRHNGDLSRILISMGIQGQINSKTRDSLLSIGRMIGYLKYNISKEDETRFTSRLETLALDALDLKDYSAFLGHKISFMQDASLGLINMEQNRIIKIFSIAAVVLLPPTLIASIYGMNFRHMPELGWKFGYPLAILLMVFSAIIPYFYIKDAAGFRGHFILPQIEAATTFEGEASIALRVGGWYNIFYTNRESSR